MFIRGINIGTLLLITAGAAAQGHWAYQPISVPELPAPEKHAQSWCRTPIDAFIRAKHEELALEPAPEADKSTLIRRLAYDLHGLPPTPEEAAEFVSDHSPHAYEHLVDRLLASPRYGERWARHWLDVAHYGETHGFDKDQRRNEAWPYRDYVIRALNEDKPYTQFTREQIAGDLLYPDSPDGIVATGFVAAGPWDLVGQTEVREDTLEKARIRVLDRDDMLANVFNTFLSTTIQCARCHDHKFDPVSLEEYYQGQAIFADVDRGNRAYGPPELIAKRNALATQIREADKSIAEANSAINALEIPGLSAFDEAIAKLEAEAKQREAERSGEGSPSNGFHSAIHMTAQHEEWVQIDLGAPQQAERIVLHPARPTDFADTPGFGFPLRFTVAVSNNPEFVESTTLVSHIEADFPYAGDIPFTVEAPDAEFRYLRITAYALWKRTDDYVFALGEAEIWKADKNIALNASVTSSSSIEAGRWSTAYLVDGFNSRKRLVAPDADAERALSRALMDARRALRDKQKERDALLTENVEEALLKTLRNAQAARDDAEKALRELPEPDEVYALTPVDRRDIHVLPRGNVATPGDLVLASVPALFGEATLPLSDTQHPRAALAEWITHHDNPLYWRSIVNRVWHYHFGRGIVDTPNDFGAMGGVPTHPELLDWLAIWFRDNGASLKKLHKLIVTSAVYRQSSQHNDSFARIDGGNRYLWRMNRAKLDAEALRDSILAISGALDYTMGGPPVELFAYTHDHSPRYEYMDHDAPGVWRRSIYRFVVRSVPDPFLAALDCADPNVSVPARAETLTALQALALLNDDFILNQAEHGSDRLQSAHGTLRDQVSSAVALCFSRTPDKGELDLLTNYAEEHGLPNLLRVLWNINEFLFID